MENQKTNNDNNLLEGVVNGDPIAFAQLMDKHHGRIYARALKLLRSKEDAEEIVQDVFMKIWQNRETLTKVNNLSAYLFTMANNQITNQFTRQMHDRKAKRELAHSPASIDNADHRVRENQYESMLNEAIQRLSPQQREIFRMARLKGMSYEDIGKKLNISPLTVKTHMQRAIKALKDSLAREDFGVLLPVILWMIG